MSTQGSENVFYFLLKVLAFYLSHLDGWSMSTSSTYVYRMRSLSWFTICYKDIQFSSTFIRQTLLPYHKSSECLIMGVSAFFFHLFNCSICLSLHCYFTVLITIALWHILRSSVTSFLNSFIFKIWDLDQSKSFSFLYEL